MPGRSSSAGSRTRSGRNGLFTRDKFSLLDGIFFFAARLKIQFDILFLREFRRVSTLISEFVCRLIRGDFDCFLNRFLRFRRLGRLSERF